MTVIISGNTGVDTVGPNTIGSSQIIDGSIPPGKLSFTYPFTKEYVSPEQTIVAGGGITLAHGLAGMPKEGSVWIVCKTAELGFSVGEVLRVHDYDYSVSLVYGVQISTDSTNVYLRVGGGGIAVMHKTTSAGNSITVANWRIVVRVWA